MAQPIWFPVSYDDLLALPDHVVGEIIDGELHTSPRPRVRHAIAAVSLAGELTPPFNLARGGPGGWIILPEPEVHVLADVVVPDLGGWRRERMPVVDLDAPYLALAPDWVCEVLSPSTEKLDRGKKLPLYARERVGHVWFVDPKAQTLEVLRLEGPGYAIALTVRGAQRARIAPFEAIELDVSVLWSL